MNIFKFKYAALALVATVLAVSSCKDYLDVNVDPNKATGSRIDLQLTTSQLYTSIGMGQRMFPNLNIWCQYHTGGPGVSLGDQDQHIMASSEGNELFRSAYRSSNNLKFILDNNRDDKYYLAIAKILTAYNYQVCVDLFGNVPYSEALQGDAAKAILHPKYDDAAGIYNSLAVELKDAIALIDDATTVGGFKTPAGDDLIYHGDMVKWRKFANTILLKMKLRSPGTAITLSTNLDDYITTNDDAAMVSFPGGSTGSNPFWNAAKSTSLGNFYIATTNSLDYLTNTLDPRIDYFYDKNGAGVHVGIKPGDIQSTALQAAAFSHPAGALFATGGRIFGPTIPVVLLSGWEGNLLIAEAAATGALSGADAETAYNAGVAASFEYLGIVDGSDTTYLQNKGKYDGVKSIALQKWVCMNGIQPIESWIETRRFDNGNGLFSSPGGIFLPPTKNALGGSVFPSILPYPETEESLNQNFPGQHPITSKVYWDL